MEQAPPPPDAHPGAAGRILRSPFGRFLEHAPEVHPVTLGFRDPELERAFQAAYLRDNLPYIRLAFLLGMVVWATFGLLARFVIVEGYTADLVLRFGVAIPSVAVGLLCTYARWFPRHWRLAMSIILVANATIWSLHGAVVVDSRPDWGYAGIMVLLAFIYVLGRLPCVDATIVGAIVIVIFNVVSIALIHVTGLDILFADWFIVTFAFIGMAAAYGLERFTRLLFLRERDLEREQRRADDLLENMMPHAIVERLKAQGGESPGAAGFLADGLDDVTVVFAVLVGFTASVSGMDPDGVIVLLNDVFTRLDAIAGSLGVQKIKTVGDAYMAVAGAPTPRADHAEAAAELAIAIVDEVGELMWPDSRPMQVRVGVATGPAVAGVIGRRTFAYDLWGDTVNLASRLESSGEPDRILVSDRAYDRLREGYSFSDPVVLTLKGKGPTPARFLLGRTDSRSEDPSV
ncbi:MAG: adenylate/guanylate cyclase domain-containing protein [Actinomycetota bacterium]